MAFCYHSMVYHSVVSSDIPKGLPLIYHSMVSWPMIFNTIGLDTFAWYIKGKPFGIPLDGIPLNDN